MLQRRSISRSLLLLGVIVLAVVGCAPASAAPTTVAPTIIAPAAGAPTDGAPTMATNPPAAMAPLPDTISVAEAAAKRDAGAFVLDVRTPEEWNEYHIPGSTLIPLDQLETRLNEVPRDKELVVVCRSGNRSKPGRDMLKNAGFTQVTSMNGGLKEWQAANLPTVTGP
jgi:rhodanese-related sulfurtransferase